MNAPEKARALGEALTIALELRLPAFPARADKRPACPHGFSDATTDPDAICDLWRRWPGELIGVPTGATSGIDVLDIDPRHGGGRWLAAHRDRLPPTRTHRTRSGGWHVLFGCNPRLHNTAGGIAAGVDTRCVGGYIIWWPAAGGTLAHADTLADWPSWLLAALLPPPRRPIVMAPIAIPDRYVRAALASASERIAAAPIGTRNTTLYREAHALARFIAADALGAGDLGDTLADAATAAGLTPREIAATLRSAIDRRSAA